MKFNPGDKVSFIDEKQDGVVVKILTNNTVLVVAIEDGFDIEVSEKELIKTGVVNLEAKAPEKPLGLKVMKKFLIFLHWLLRISMYCCNSRIHWCCAHWSDSILPHNNCNHQVLFTFYSKIKNHWEGIKSSLPYKTGENKLIFKSKHKYIDISLMQVQGLLFSPHQLPGTGYFQEKSLV